MSWVTAMAIALDWSKRYGVRSRVFGVRFHDEAGLVPDQWIYQVKVIR